MFVNFYSKFCRLRESDSKLTDIRLAALNYQHELEQMKNEIRRLREERDNLKSSSNQIRISQTSLANTSANQSCGTLSANQSCGTLNSNKTSENELENENKIVVFLELCDTERKIIGNSFQISAKS